MDLGTYAHRRKDKVRQSPAPALTGARRNILLACLALLATLTLAAPADAGIGKYRLGVVVGPLAGLGDLDRMKSARVRSAKMIFSWDAIESKKPTGGRCGTAEYTGWDRYDLEIIEASRRGISILPYIFDTPDYASRRSHHMPSTRKPGQIEPYKCFLRALVRRYGHGGRLVREEPSAKPIEEWQIWNEPNLPAYSASGEPNPREYGRFVKISGSVIDGVDRRATVVVGGMPEIVARGMPLDKYLTRFYQVKGVRKKFDVIALHPYARDARGVKGALTRMRDVLRRVGDSRQVIWITEVGYATDGPKGHWNVNTEKQQARKLKRTFSFLKKNHRRYKVGTVHWFRWRDQAAYSPNAKDWSLYAGLYRKNGTPKPACHKYLRFTGAGGKCRRIVDEEPQSGLIPGLPGLPDFDFPPPSAGLLPSPPE